MTDSLTLTTLNSAQFLIDLATNGLEDNTRAAYSRHLRAFFAWMKGSELGFTRMGVQAWKQHLMNQDYSPSTVNQALTAVRKLADEGRYHGLDPLVVEGITRIKSVAKSGRRVGHWLSPDQVKFLFDCTGQDTLKGYQERAMLALMVGCALRRDETANLVFEQIQQRDDIWLLVDIIGKGNKTRSVPLAPWVKRIIDKWSNKAGVSTGLILRAVNKVDRLTGPVKTRLGHTTNGGVSGKAIYKKVVAIANRCGAAGLGPHSLRRTWARRAYKQGYPLDQIQAILGHESIRTTELYIGLRGLDLESPVYVTY
jgi:site-specific recombinase XerD